MIAWVVNLSAEAAEDALRGSWKRAQLSPPAGLREAWLGITDPHVRGPVERPSGKDNRPRLALRFKDYDPDQWTNRGLPILGAVNDADGPLPAHAAEIAAYVRRLHESPERYALCIHCHAGVSRSGAVAQWAHETTGAEWASGVATGRARACPNETLLRLLGAT